MPRFLIVCFVVIFAAAVFITALRNNAASFQTSVNSQTLPEFSPTIAQTPDTKDSSIRQVDFSNFTFAGSKKLFSTAEYETEKFTLHNGKSEDTQNQYAMELQNVEYGDATGDGAEEAMISLSVLTDGSAGVNHVYVFTLENKRPKFLWGFESGDRAWGGLKRVYAGGGELVVELFGKGTQIGDELGSTEAVGLCCPLSFTRTHYDWRSNRFEQRGEIEILPYERIQRETKTQSF